MYTRVFTNLSQRSLDLYGQECGGPGPLKWLALPCLGQKELEWKDAVIPPASEAALVSLEA